MKWPYIKSIRMDTYKLFLSLGVLALFGVVVWTGIKLFSDELPAFLTPLIGSLLFIAEVGLFVWSARVLRRNIKRSPSFRLIVFSLLGVLLVLAFAGVEALGAVHRLLAKHLWLLVTTVAILLVVTVARRGRSRKKAQPTKQPHRVATSPPSGQAARRRIATYKGTLTEAVNNARRRHGLRALGRVEFLDKIATGHATHMWKRKRCDHDRIGDRIRMIEQGAGLHYIAENCFMYPTNKWNDHVATKIVERWMKSAGHRKNILNPRFTRTGIGWRLKNGYFYAVQIFTE